LNTASEVVDFCKAADGSAEIGTAFPTSTGSLIEENEFAGSGVTLLAGLSAVAVGI
jgi:hypothetical protein